MQNHVKHLSVWMEIDLNQSSRGITRVLPWDSERPEGCAKDVLVELSQIKNDKNK